MNKIAMIGDLHIGAKNDDIWTQNNIYETLKWFTDDCKSKGIKYCLQAGDWFDVRKGISQITLQFVREKIVPMFQETFEMTYVIVGNHDMKHKEKITPNSCTEVLARFDKFTVIEEPTTINIHGVTIDMIPWICKENQSNVFEFIKNSYSDYCMGHFELNGFYYYKGLKSHGLEPDFLEKYEGVFSGHFHTISNSGNVRYLGTPYSLTMSDANDVRGYWTLDTDATSNGCSLHQNPVTYHHRVYFDADTWKYSADDLKKLFSNKTVKLVIEKCHSDTKKTDIDKVLDDFEQICHEFKHEYNEVVSNSDEAQLSDDIEIQKTFEIIEEQIESLEETQCVKDRVTKIFNGLYLEAMSEE